MVDGGGFENGESWLDLVPGENGSKGDLSCSHLVNFWILYGIDQTLRNHCVKQLF